MDMHLIPRCAPALPFGNAKPVPVYIEERAINTQRAIGTTLSHEVPPSALTGLRIQPWLLEKHQAQFILSQIRHTATLPCWTALVVHERTPSLLEGSLVYHSCSL